MRDLESVGSISGRVLLVDRKIDSPPFVNHSVVIVFIIGKTHIEL